MNLDLLHVMCKSDARKGFNEFKRVVQIRLFSMSKDYKEDLQDNLLQGLFTNTVKHFVMTYNLSSIQLEYLTSVTDYYKNLVFKVSDNYIAKHYDTL